MRKKKNTWKYVVSVLLLIAIVYLSSELFAMYRLGLTKVCIAKVSIPERTMISEEYLDYIEVPKAYINDDCYLLKEEVVGKYVKLDAYIPKGSIIYRDFLEGSDNMKDYLHLELGKDEVTYDLFVRDIKVNPAHLMKGMNVDLYLTINRKEIMSDLLISGARITGLYDVNDKEIKNNNDNYSLGTISIAVKREMVPYINKAIAIGEVSLLVSSDLYSDKEMYLNDTSKIFEQLS